MTPTTHLSMERYPTLHTQLSYYRILLYDLGKIVAEEDKNTLEGSNDLATACDNACNKLNKYWMKSDKHTALGIVMLLDPRSYIHIHISHTSVILLIVIIKQMRARSS